MTSELKAKVEEKRASRIKWFDPTAQRVVKTAWAGKSRKAGIKAFCLECMGCQRADITTCTAYACPLWPYRPYQREDQPSADNPSN